MEDEEPFGTKIHSLSEKDPQSLSKLTDLQSRLKQFHKKCAAKYLFQSPFQITNLFVSITK